jgi:hypothetical protein
MLACAMGCFFVLFEPIFRKIESFLNASCARGQAENMCLLNNELIKSNLLQELDYTFYKNITNMLYAEQLQKSEKRKASIEKAKCVKNAKVRNTECILEVV